MRKKLVSHRGKSQWSMFEIHNENWNNMMRCYIMDTQSGENESPLGNFDHRLTDSSIWNTNIFIDFKIPRMAQNVAFISHLLQAAACAIYLPQPPNS